MIHIYISLPEHIYIDVRFWSVIFETEINDEILGNTQQNY